MATDGDINWSSLERPLDTGEAQAYDQDMLAEFSKKHAEAEAAKASSAA
jgi:hypothetical protein